VYVLPDGSDISRATGHSRKPAILGQLDPPPLAFNPTASRPLCNLISKVVVPIRGSQIVEALQYNSVESRDTAALLGFLTPFEFWSTSALPVSPEGEAGPSHSSGPNLRLRASLPHL
jgi:hypothetical protein